MTAIVRAKRDETVRLNRDYSAKFLEHLHTLAIVVYRFVR